MRFECVVRRKIGEVSDGSHGRQGALGDWRSYFTSQVWREFHALYGNVRISSGYEPDDSWAASQFGAPLVIHLSTTFRAH